MSNVTSTVIQSMLNHLAVSYSEDEARNILVQRYPDRQNEIRDMVIVNALVSKVEEEEPSVDLNRIDSPAPVKTKQSKPAKDPAEKKASKMDAARELFVNAEDKSRKTIIDRFVSELGMSKAMASTYFYAVKK